MAEIVKIQRPVQPPNGPWLIYNEGQTVYMMLPPSSVPDDVKQLMGTEYKIYAEGFVVGDSLTVGKKVGEQPW